MTAVEAVLQDSVEKFYRKVYYSTEKVYILLFEIQMCADKNTKIDKKTYFIICIYKLFF